MTVAQARALVPDAEPRVEEWDPDRERAALDRLAAWATRFSPLVAAEAPDRLLVDITGCERLWRGERRLLNALCNGLEGLGFSCRGCVAPTFAAARAAALTSGECRSVVGEGELVERVSGLPVSGLGLEPEAESALVEMGARRIGEVLGLPRSALPARFGRELPAALDRLLGVRAETIDPVRPLPAASASRVFAGPVRDVGTVECAVRELAEALAEELGRRESGARRVELRLERSDLGPESCAVELSRPSRDAAHLWALLRPRLERMHLGFGVDAVLLTASSASRLRHEEPAGWWGTGGAAPRRGGPGPGRAGRRGPAEGDRALAEVVDVLAGRLGAGSVVRRSLRATWDPSREVQEESAVSGADARPVGETQPGGGPHEMGRPTRVFQNEQVGEGRGGDAARTRWKRGASGVEGAGDRGGDGGDGGGVRVLCVWPGGAPRWVSWAGGEGVVTHAVGPERRTGEWWREAPAGGLRCAGRDYYRARTEDGRWLWLARELDTGAWSVRGEWA